MTSESQAECQPHRSGDRQVALVADARIDNREELLGAVELAGLPRSQPPSDAELILAAYECWGVDCAHHLVGDFAFALWDGRHRRLLCVRDPLGVKQLHYGTPGGCLCFATEAQQVLQHPGVDRGLDEQAVAGYLLNLFDDEERTLFAGVKRLPPAHRLVLEQGRLRVERYWCLDDLSRTFPGSDEEAVEQFLELLTLA